MKPETTDKVLTKALKLQKSLELDGQNPIGNASGNSAGVNHLTIQFFTENTGIFIEFARLVEREADKVTQN